MAKTIRVQIATCISVKKADGSEYSSKDWHSATVGLTGIVAIYESEHVDPGKRFINFSDPYGNCTVRTGGGELWMDDKYIVLSTKNSMYTYEIKDTEAIVKSIFEQD